MNSVIVEVFVEYRCILFCIVAYCFVCMPRGAVEVARCGMNCRGVTIVRWIFF